MQWAIEWAFHKQDTNAGAFFVSQSEPPNLRRNVCSVAEELGAVDLIRADRVFRLEMRNLQAPQRPGQPPFQLWEDSRAHLGLAFSPIVNLEFVSFVGRKDSGHVAQALRKSWRSQQRVFALAQIVVIEIDSQR